MKKAQTHMWWIIIAAILAILVLVFVLIWFKGTGDKAYTTLGDQLGGLKDCDNDHVADAFDKCPCDEAGDTPVYEGCPRDVQNKEDSRYGTKTSECPETCTNG